MLNRPAADLTMKSSTFPSLPSCAYCQEPCFSAQGVPTPSAAGIYYFCTPECVCAYNVYVLKGDAQTHVNLEKFYERRVICAPWRTQLATYSLSREGVVRREWLPKCYEPLTAEERAKLGVYKKDDVRLSKK